MRIATSTAARLLAGLLGLALLGSCKGDDGGKSQPAGTDTGAAGPTDTGSGSGTGTEDDDDADDDADDEEAVPGTGTVSLQVTPVSTSPDFVSLEAERVESLPPGTLALPTGAELTSAPRVFSLTGGATPVFHPEWIASGAPRGVRLTIKKIMLMPKAEDGESQAAEVIFTSEAGVEIQIDSGAVDLTPLLAAVGSTGGVKFEVDEGTYDEVRVTYERAATVRGCVSAAFKDAPSTTRTFCTKAGKSVFETTTAADADFETTGQTEPEGEWMQLDLDKSWVGEAGATDDYIIGYPLDVPLVVEKDKSVTLSLVVDLNRLLRYHRGAPTGQGPNPSFPPESSYFFTTLFAESLYVFAGRPGRIYGYEGVVEACTTENWKADETRCTASPSTVAFWMTFVTNEDGKTLLFNTMPDDDNALTIVKGSTFGEPGFLKAGAAGGVDVRFSLGDDVGGWFRNFPASLEADAVGEVVDGVELESEHVSGETYHGKPIVTRRL